MGDAAHTAFTNGALRFTFEAMMRLPFFSILVCLLLSLAPVLPAAAQDNSTLTGTVLDAVDATPLPGAAVFANGQGVLTDLDGQFSISASGSVELKVRYVGYVAWTTQLDAWTGTQNLDIALEPMSPASTPQWCPPGGTNKTWAMASIDVLPPELVNQGAPTSADQSLSRTPGVTIVDSEPQIRGGSGYSFGAGSRVAVLLDGLPVLSGDAGRPTWGFLPLENLEQVEVVKGPAVCSTVLQPSVGSSNSAPPFPTRNPSPASPSSTACTAIQAMAGSTGTAPSCRAAPPGCTPADSTTATASASGDNGWEATGTKGPKSTPPPVRPMTAPTIPSPWTITTRNVSGVSTAHGNTPRKTGGGAMD